MKKNIKKYNYNTIYGINNCINLLRQYRKYTVEYIYMNKDSVAVKNKDIMKLLASNNCKINYLNNKSFNEKYNYKHNQGIIIYFSGQITKNLNEITEFKISNHDSMKYLT